MAWFCSAKLDLCSRVSGIPKYQFWCPIICRRTTGRTSLFPTPSHSFRVYLAEGPHISTAKNDTLTSTTERVVYRDPFYVFSVQQPPLSLCWYQFTFIRLYGYIYIYIIYNICIYIYMYTVHVNVTWERDLESSTHYLFFCVAKGWHPKAAHFHSSRG